MKPRPPIIKFFTAVPDLDARHLASMDPKRLWEWARKGYLTWPDGGPELLVLNSQVHALPREGWIARFPSSDEAERTLLAAGFRPSGRLFRFRP